MTNKDKNAQLGSAFFYILLGVALFGALAFTVSRGMRSQTTSTLTNREADLMASDLLSYAQKVERGVSRIMQKRGMSADQISFYNRFSELSDYENGDCADEDCLVFNSVGGGVNWQDPPEGATEQAWHFTNAHHIPEFDGTGDAGIVMHLFGVSDKICEMVNRHLGHNFVDTPIYSGNLSADAFTGTYAAGTLVTCGGSCAGKAAACIEIDGAYSVRGENLGEGNLFYYGVYVMPSDF